ncbi:MAG: hypothetical protein HQL09_05905 [Nitrospirae bacterium]|nr:hypothetical protein [Nitrospirota bacterium]
MRHIFFCLTVLLVIMCSQVSADDPNNINSQVGDLQQQMLNNPALLQLIMSLQDNPKFKQALQDPEILEAIKTGNISRLTSNPIINQLINNPAVQEIYKKVK